MQWHRSKEADPTALRDRLGSDLYIEVKCKKGKWRKKGRINCLMKWERGGEGSESFDPVSCLLLC